MIQTPNPKPQTPNLEPSTGTDLIHFLAQWPSHTRASVRAAASSAKTLCRLTLLKLPPIEVESACKPSSSPSSSSSAADHLSYPRLGTGLIPCPPILSSLKDTCLLSGPGVPLCVPGVPTRSVITGVPPWPGDAKSLVDRGDVSLLPGVRGGDMTLLDLRMGVPGAVDEVPSMEASACCLFALVFFRIIR